LNYGDGTNQMPLNDPSDPMPGGQQDYSPEFDEENRRRQQMENQPTPHNGHDEEADRIRRLNGGSGIGGEI